MPNPVNHPRDQILAACLDAWERGDHAEIERICRERPELAAEVRASGLVLAEIHVARGDGDGGANAAALARTPATIGRFRITAQLGHGGMGIVYRAHDPALRREVALKVLHPGLRASPRAVERFRREARALAQIHHPNIVVVHDVGETADGVPYFAMDLVEGASLAQLLRAAVEVGIDELTAAHLRSAKRPPSGSYLAAAACLVREVAEALHHAHEEGITHRDVKPANILVNDSGEARLVDFGIARELESTTATSPQTLLGAGTPSYMAPEQIAERGATTVGPWTDIYALGVTLYEVITLQRPFSAPTSQQVFQCILEREPPSPRRLNPLVPRDLETICMTALAKDPRQRYTSARAFAEDLAGFLSSRPIRARPPGAIDRAIKLVRRNPWPAVLACAAILAASGGLIAGQGRASRREKEAQRLVAKAESLVVDSSLEAQRLIDSSQLLRRANELSPENEPGRELLNDIEAFQLELQTAVALNVILAECRHLRDVGGDIRKIDALTRDALLRLNELALRSPASLSMRRFREVLVERSLATRPAPIGAQEAPPGQAPIVVSGEPGGTELFLFRYSDRGNAASSPGQTMLRPVPFHPAAGICDRPASGEPALAVAQVSPGGPAARAGIRTGDLLLRSVDGKLPAGLEKPLPAGGLTLRVLSDGREREVRLEGSSMAGIAALATAYPLACAADNRIGALPDCRIVLEPGSYLVLARCAGHEDLRVPVLVREPGETVMLRLDLHAEGTTLNGFVHVAPGWFLCGEPAVARWMDGYWIGRNEVSVAEYLEFLRDGRTRADIERARRKGQCIRVPRKRWGEREARVIHDPLWSGDADAGYEPDRDLVAPVSSISCDDCDAYCRWLTTRARERDEPWVFRLPTEDEWEKAARGVDGRTFPWGDRFDPKLCRADTFLVREGAEWSHRPPKPEPSAGDESPFGVQAMAGGVIEWCLGAFEDEQKRPWRGGTWEQSDTSYFRCAANHGGYPWRVDMKDGFRVVAVRREIDR